MAGRVWVCARWAAALSCLLLLSGCDEERPSPPRTAPGHSDAGVVSHLPVTDHVARRVKRAAAAAARLRTSLDRGRPSRKDYLQLRQELAALRPFLRVWATESAQSLLAGGESADARGGALSLLDRSLARGPGRGSVAAAGKQVGQLISAIRRVDYELVVRPLAPAAAAQALSDGAYELGAMLIEADDMVADDQDAVLADWRGMLAGIEDGAVVLARLKTETPAVAMARRALVAALDPLEDALAEVGQARQVKGRAELVAATGRLGVAARLFAQALGAPATLPYNALRPVSGNGLREPVTVLTLPEVPRDPGRADAAALARVGATLFGERRLSTDGTRSCASCHDPGRAFSQDAATAARRSSKAPPRNTPTLLYAAYLPAQGWDGGIDPLSLDHAAATLGGGAADLLRRVSSLPVPAAEIGALFPGGLTPAHIGRALAAFLARDGVVADAPIDRFARGDRLALSPQASAGFDVFVGQGRCARCHTPPLFGGLSPPRFGAVRFARVGVPTRPGAAAIDADPGREAVSGEASDRHAFRIPSLRNVSRTAPYFHHGAFGTLEEVLAFYQRGPTAEPSPLPGGRSSLQPLALSEEQLRDLATFLSEALSDAPAPR